MKYGSLTMRSFLLDIVLVFLSVLLVTIGVLAKDQTVLYEGSLYRIDLSYFVSLSLIAVSAVICFSGLIDQKFKSFLCILNRYAAIWLLLGALSFTVANWEYPREYPLIWILIFKSALYALCVDLATGLFYGLLFALSIPFLSALGTRIGLWVLENIVRQRPLGSQIVSMPVKQIDITSVVSFIRRSLFIALTTVPVLTQRLGIHAVTVSLAETGWVVGFTPEFQAAMYCVTLIVGVGYFLEHRGLRINRGNEEEGRPLSESYFKWIMAAASVTGLISMVPFLQDIWSFALNPTSVLGACYVIMSIYSIILGSAVSIIIVDHKFASSVPNVLPLLGALLFMKPFVDQLKTATGLSVVESWSELSTGLVWSLPFQGGYLRHILPSIVSIVLLPVMLVWLVRPRPNRAGILRIVLGIVLLLLLCLSSSGLWYPNQIGFVFSAAYIMILVLGVQIHRPVQKRSSRNQATVSGQMGMGTGR